MALPPPLIMGWRIRSFVWSMGYLFNLPIIKKIKHMTLFQLSTICLTYAPNIQYIRVIILFSWLKKSCTLIFLLISSCALLNILVRTYKVTLSYCFQIFTSIFISLGSWDKFKSMSSCLNGISAWKNEKEKKKKFFLS